MDEKKAAVALGFFDGVHLGHQAVLRAAVEQAEKENLIPSVFTFRTGTMPQKQGREIPFLYPESYKEKQMHQLGIQQIYSPDFREVCHLDGDTFCKEILVERLHAQAVFCGRDFRFGAKAACDFSDLEEYGEKYHFAVCPIEPVPYESAPVSSTRIRTALLAGDAPLAAALLGKPYAVSGTVIHGENVGHTHAVPTINLGFEEGQLLPAFGVYVSETVTPEGSYASITNIGKKPTMGADFPAGAETFLLDFQGDLYGKECTVYLRQFLRQEMKFPNTESLYRAIAKDQENALAWWRKERNQHE